jgi:uncharacterized protein (UPF0332 family)
MQRTHQPLLSKSEWNFLAAKLLIEKEYPNSSVHCSYYSCVQLMRYILMEKYGQTIESIYSSSKDEKGGSHEALINMFIKHLRGLNFNFREFNTEIQEIKSYRNEVDYKYLEVNKDTAREIRRKAESVRVFLKQKFL